MNRNKKNGRANLKRTDVSTSDHNRNRNRNYDLEEVLPPKSRRNPFKAEKNADRSCYFTPEKKDASQLTEVDGTDLYQSLLTQQYGFEPIIPQTINQLKELRKVLCESTPKVDDSSQYISPEDAFPLSPLIETSDVCHWQNVEDTKYIDEIVDQNNAPVPVNSLSVTNNLIISEVPRVKVIAEKFSRYKKDNIEVRRLEEKVVCVEYDVYEDVAFKPVQKLRAYFSIQDNCKRRNTVSALPSKVKHEFDIAEEDLKKLNEKEIEIIDGKIEQNKPYIDDLKRVLKRKQAIYMKKNKSSLDLRALYEMAKSERPFADDNFSDTNMLSKAELNDIKQLILKTCTSSAYGINRKTVKPEKDTNCSKYANVNVVSNSIFVELLRNDKQQ